MSRTFFYVLGNGCDSVFLEEFVVLIPTEKLDGRLTGQPFVPSDGDPVSAR
jgi:hypothetical protein